MGNHNTLEIPPDASDVWFQGNKVGTGMTKKNADGSIPGIVGPERLFFLYLILK